MSTKACGRRARCRCAGRHRSRPRSWRPPGRGAAEHAPSRATVAHEFTPCAAMTIREILKMGDPRLLRVAQPVVAFDTPEMRTLIDDMFETMHSVNGAGLAAPQIGVDLALVIF